MTQTIEQLTARVRELEKENTRLSDGAVCGDCDGSGWLENRVEGRYPCTCMTEAEPYQLLAEQLAAEQLNNKLLREHLRKLIEFELLNAGALSTDELCAEFRQAVIAYNTTIASTEALDAYVAEKVKEAKP